MRLALFLLAGLGSVAPALAQDAAVDRDTVTIGIGAGMVPRYEGADDHSILPALVARGRVGGIGFITVGTALYVDLVPGRDGPGGKFVLGPVVHATLNRISEKRTRDPRIVALGETDLAVEVGGQIGYVQTGVITSDYDTLSFNIAAYHDVAGGHESYAVVPSISYTTPLSTKMFVGINASATYVGDKYARYYFGVTPAQAPVSGLPAFTPGGGFKDMTFGALAGFSLTGDLRRGLAVFAIGSYSKLLGDFKRSPLVSVAGDSNQFFGGVGIAYTF